jgi:hypothetical protein
MSSHWPTDLYADGTAPVNIALVASGDEHLTRQAMYQLQAGTQLQERGFAIEAFQIPIVGKMIRITVPIAAAMPDGRNAVVYTQSEEWTPGRIGDLQTWIANLREESDAAIVVASRLPLPDAASAPEVASWLHLPYDTLNKPAAAPVPAGELAVLPCLKEAKWRGREDTVCRALWEGESSPYMPWLAVGYDRPHTFEFINTNRLPELKTTERALEAQALANLRARPAAWEPVNVEVKGKTLRMLCCSGDYFAAEQVMNPAFMQEAQRKFKTHGLFVGVPRRGLLMVTAAGQDDQMIAAFGAAVAGQFSRGETAPISPMLFAIKDGAIVGILEAIANAVVPEEAPKGTTEESEEETNDPNAPFVSAIVTRNDRGTEDVHLLAGGEDGERLAKAIETGFKSLLTEHMARTEFSGHVQIVVLGMTPPAARKRIPQVLEHLRGICNEISRGGERRYRVTLTFQKDAFEPTSNAPSAVTASAVAGASAAPPAARRRWLRPSRWVMALAGAALAYAASNRVQSVPSYPDTIGYGTAQLSQAGNWDRGGTSGAVYVPAGEALPGASLQVGVIVSTERATANDLLTWIRNQPPGSDNQRYHDNGTGTDRCIVGVNTTGNGHRTYMALQLCETGTSGAACIESDRVLDDGVFGSCLQNARCFDAVCHRRWLDEREKLGLALAGFVTRGD